MLVNIENELRDTYAFKNELICPHCNGGLDHAIESRNEGREPMHGDFTICVGCGEISNYEVDSVGNFSLRKSTDEDLIIAKEQGLYDDLIKMQNYIRNTPHGLKVNK